MNGGQRADRYTRGEWLRDEQRRAIMRKLRAKRSGRSMDGMHQKWGAGVAGSTVLDKIEAAKTALRQVLSSPVPSGVSVGEACSVGNRATLALHILSDEKAIDRQSITMTLGAWQRKDD